MRAARSTVASIAVIPVSHNGNELLCSWQGESAYPLVIVILFGIFGAASLIWISYIAKAGQGASKIHFLMAGLVIIKSLTLLSQSVEFFLIKTTGNPQVGETTRMRRRGVTLYVPIR